MTDTVRDMLLASVIEGNANHLRCSDAYLGLERVIDACDIERRDPRASVYTRTLAAALGLELERVLAKFAEPMVLSLAEKQAEAEAKRDAERPTYYPRKLEFWIANDRSET